MRVQPKSIFRHRHEQWLLLCLLFCAGDFFVRSGNEIRNQAQRTIWLWTGLKVMKLLQLWLSRRFQIGAEAFEIVNSTIKFTASVDDVTLMITKGEDVLSTISSVVILDGALPGDPARQEYCEAACGVTSELIGQILGGNEARMGAWPWNAGLLFLFLYSKTESGFSSNLLQVRWIKLELPLRRNNYQQKDFDNNCHMFVHARPVNRSFEAFICLERNDSVRIIEQEARGDVGEVARKLQSRWFSSRKCEIRLQRRSFGSCSWNIILPACIACLSATVNKVQLCR